MGKHILSIAFILTFFVAMAFSQQKNETAASVKVPVSYGIVVDNSGSMRASLEKVIESIKEVIRSNDESDEAFLVRFTNSDKIRLVQEFTKDKSFLQEAADNLYVEEGLTAIIDAVEFSAKYLSENAVKESGRKKVLILITDGEERQSQMKIEDAVKSLKEKDIKVFSIGISDEIVVKKVLEKFANGNGGKLFLPKNQLELTAAVNELIKIIRVQ